MKKTSRQVKGMDSISELLSEFQQDPKAAVLKYGLAKVIETQRKYEKHRRIVEEGFVRIEVHLDLDPPRFPLVEVTVDGLHLGYINGYINESGQRNEREKTNKGEFQLETYKRGTGTWDKRTICVAPVRKGAHYYRKAKKEIRLAGGSKSSKKTIAIYIPLSRRRTVWGTKKKPPEYLS